MIFHNEYTITIDQFALMFERKQEVKRLNIWVPKFFINKAYDKLIKKYNELTNKKQNDVLLNDRYHATDIEIRIQLYSTLLTAFKNSMFIEPDKELLELYKKHFKKDFEYSDIENIVKKIKLLTSKYKALLKRLETPKNKDFDFAEMVNNLKGLVGAWVGKEKLYTMPYHLKTADNIIKSKEKV
jgi:hypothetical protein